MKLKQIKVKDIEDYNYYFKESIACVKLLMYIYTKLFFDLCAKSF